MQVIRQSFTADELPERTAEIILNSWRSSTRCQYAVYINRWKKFCQENGLDPVVVNISAVLRFLTEIYDNHKSYSTVNTARCALSSFLVLDSGHTVGTHPLVSRFVRGVYNMSPPVPRYTEVWDVRIVLNFLRSWAPVSTLGLRDLTYKLCMLIALLSAQRCQSLHLLRIYNMTLKADSVVFTIQDLIKQSKPGKTGLTFTLKAYPLDKRLCICHVLKHYLNCTEPLRGQTKQLFISFRKPHAAVTKNTISNWLRAVLNRAGIDTNIYKGHSTRAAASSAANKNQVPVSDILTTAGWANENTFRLYYNKPIQKTPGQFGEAILNSCEAGPK